MISCAKIQKTLVQPYSNSENCAIFAEIYTKTCNLKRNSMEKYTNFIPKKTQVITFLVMLLVIPMKMWAEDEPTIAPSVTYTTSDGETNNDENFSGSAPIKATFMANPTDDSGWTSHFEWRVYHDNDTVPYIIRYEENMDLEFNQSGLHRIVLHAKFTKDGETIEADNEDSPFTLTISESFLQMPNAFSPNGDGINDIYKAKDGYQSLTEFHAYIFNRWGQKLYEWNDPAGGWDGTYKGKPVKDGVYFCLVKAKGADGKTYNIKKDVNLLRGYTESGSISQ